MSFIFYLNMLQYAESLTRHVMLDNYMSAHWVDDMKAWWSTEGEQPGVMCHFCVTQSLPLSEPWCVCECEREREEMRESETWIVSKSIAIQPLDINTFTVIIWTCVVYL